MKKSKFRPLLRGLAIVVAVLICSSAVSAEVAFQVSRITRTSIWCRLLIMPQFGGDTFASPSQIRPYCVGKSVGQYGEIEDCLAIRAIDPEDAQSMRHHCIDALANRLLQPELCRRIEYPASNLLSKYNEQYQERCRAWSISTVEECYTGFQTGWGKSSANECYKTLALNLKDASFCDRIPDMSERTSCHENVETLDRSLYQQR